MIGNRKAKKKRKNKVKQECNSKAKEATVEARERVNEYVGISTGMIWKTQESSIGMQIYVDCDLGDRNKCKTRR